MLSLFISYDPGDRDPYLARFLDELRQRVQALLPGAEFFEDREMAIGANWKRRAFEAAGTCQALLGIYSPRYFNNADCGRTFEIFRWRMELLKDRAGGRSVPVIFPVIWEPVRGRIPEPASDIQFARPEFPRAACPHTFRTATADRSRFEICWRRAGFDTRRL